MASGVRDASVAFAAQIASAVISIGTTSCLAWTLGPAGRGSYAVCMIFMTLLTVIFFFGSDSAGMYYIASREFTLSEGVIHTVIHGLIGSGLAITAGLVIMQMPLSFLSKASPTDFYLALAALPLAFFAATFTRFLIPIQEIGWFAFISVASTLLMLIFYLFFLLFLGWGVSGALLAVIFNSLITTLMALGVFRRKHSLTWAKPSFNSLTKMFHYGVRYYFGKVSNLVNLQIGTIILALFASKENVGLFALASGLVHRTEAIPYSLNTALIPRSASHNEGRHLLVAQCARISFVICGLLLLVLAIFANPIVALLFSPKFLPAVPAIRILAIGMVVRCACKLLGTYLTFRNRPGIASIAVAVGMLANLVLLWFLLPILGLAGAALATTANYLISSAILQWAFTRYSGLGLLETWRFRGSDWSTIGKLLRRVSRKVAPAQNDTE